MMPKRLLLFAFVVAASGCRTQLLPRPPSPAATASLKALEAEPVPAGERSYILLFGAQSEPKRAVDTHTFCTVVRVAADGTVAEQVTISWMPRTLKIRPFTFAVEPGINLELPETLTMAEGCSERTTLFGPYEIPAELFRRLRLQEQYLEGYTIGYQGFDLIGEAGVRGNGSNCTHAINDADPKLGRAGYLLAGNGVNATRFIRDEMRRRGVLLDPGTTHDWLVPALGLDASRFRRE